MKAKKPQSQLKSATTIKTVFMDMLREKPFKSIRVVDICLKAHLNRSSFYASFSSIDDLFLQVQRDFIDGMKGLIVDYGKVIDASDEERANKFLPIINYFKENKEIYLLLIESNDSGLLATNIVTYIKSLIVDHIDIEMDYLLTYAIMGGFATIGSWLVDDMLIDEKKLAYICTPTINSKLIKR